MAKRKDRINTNHDANPLTDNPFGALAGMAGDLPEGPPEPETPTTDKPAASAYAVGRTKKGNYPIFFEKRPNGKVVTVVRKVSGDAEGLLRLLKKACGTGGTLAEDGIELQGDQRTRVEEQLKRLGL
ncbi:MAG: translation initiation factor [bacterium]|nr:translation initiation factor [bacterium]